MVSAVSGRTLETGSGVDATVPERLQWWTGSILLSLQRALRRFGPELAHP